MSLPWDSASIVASALAMGTGCRCPRMKTEEPSRARDVHMATALRTASGSRYGLSGGCGKLPPRPYPDVTRGMTTWSLTHNESIPRASASRANVINASRAVAGPWVVGR